MAEGTEPGRVALIVDPQKVELSAQKPGGNGGGSTSVDWPKWAQLTLTAALAFLGAAYSFGGLNEKVERIDEFGSRRVQIIERELRDLRDKDIRELRENQILLMQAFKIEPTRRSQ